MSTKDLKDKYGEGKTRGIINRAIRAEIPGGAKLLDLMDELSGRETFITRALVAIRDEMDKEIRRRYGMSLPSEGSDD